MSLAPSRYPGFSGAGAARLRDGAWRVVVVGAGGWLGLASLEMLHGLFGQDFDRRVVCFGSTRRALTLRGGRSVDQEPLERIAELPAAPSLVLHLAFLTQEKAKAMSADAYAAANRAISRRVLDALDAIGARGVFVPSSGAVYGVGEAGVERSKQQYGALKLEDEANFAAWCEARGGNLAIARVFNLSGPYINKQSSYALACFIADALAGRPILVRAQNPVYRSFTAIAELMSVVAGVLTDPTSRREHFDTAGDEALEMGGIAAVVADVLGAAQGIERPIVNRSDPPDRYVGDGATYARLRRLYGVRPIDFPAQIRATADFMAQSESSRT